MPTRIEVIQALKSRDEFQNRDIAQILDYLEQEASGSSSTRDAVLGAKSRTKDAVTRRDLTAIYNYLAELGTPASTIRDFLNALAVRRDIVSRALVNHILDLIDGASFPFQPGAVLAAGSPGSRYENAVASPSADGQQGTFFCWIKYELPSVGSIFELSGSGSGFFFVQPQSDGQTNVLGRNAAGGTVLTELSTSDKLGDGVWTAIMVAWDLSVPTANYFFQPLDGAALDVANVDIPVDDTIDLDGTPASIYGGTGTGVNLIDCSFSQMMMDNTIYTDFSVGANREKFVTSAGKPIDLGSDAAVALGAPAEFYLPDGDIRGVANWLLVGGTGAVVTTPGPV